jgi:hypothetical protein
MNGIFRAIWELPKTPGWRMVEKARVLGRFFFVDFWIEYKTNEKVTLGRVLMLSCGLFYDCTPEVNHLRSLLCTIFIGNNVQITTKTADL